MLEPGPRTVLVASTRSGHQSADQQIFCVNPNNGHILHICCQPDGNDWVFSDLSVELSGVGSGEIGDFTTSTGRVSTFTYHWHVTSGTEVCYLFYKGLDHTLQELSFDPASQTWLHQSHPNLPKMHEHTTIVSLSFQEEQFVLYIDLNEEIIILSRGSEEEEMTHENISEACGFKFPAKSIAAQVVDGAIGIFCAGGDSKLHGIEGYTSAWELKTDLYNRRIPRSSVVPMSCFVTDGKVPHCLFVGSDDHLHEVYRRNDSWSHIDLTDLSGSPDISPSHPITSAIDDEGSTHIYFVSGEDDYFTLRTIYWHDNAWKTVQITDTCWQQDEENLSEISAIGPLVHTSQDGKRRAVIMGLEEPTLKLWKFNNSSSSPSFSTQLISNKSQHTKKMSGISKSDVPKNTKFSASLGIGKGKHRVATITTNDIPDFEPHTQTITPNCWNKELGAWAPVKGNEKNYVDLEEISELKLLTFNVLFHKVVGDLRHPELLKIVETHMPHFAVFQEVTLPFLQLLLNQQWMREYYISDIEGETIDPYGVVMISRLPLHNWTIHHLPTRLARKTIKAEVLTKNADGEENVLAVCGAHFESYPQDGPIRKLQLDLIFDLMKNADHSVLMGDFNFGDGPENCNIDDDYVDVWSFLMPDQDGYTFNYRENNLTKVCRNYEVRRYDRILSSKSELWKPTFVEIIGNQPFKLPEGTTAKIKGLTLTELWPSDHFGLFAVLTLCQQDGAIDIKKARA